MGLNPQSAIKWLLGPDEAILACLNPLITGVKDSVPASDQCNRCIRDPYRIIVIESKGGQQRRIAVCLQHFLQACKDCDARNFCMSAARLHVLLSDGNQNE
jgi:hypothetical protein